MSSIPASYETILNDFVQDPTQQATIWNNFVAANGANAPLQTFLTYIEGSLGDTPPSNYQAILNAFAPNNPAMQASMWGGFVSTLSIPAGSTLAQTLAQSSTVTQFINFVGKAFAANVGQVAYSLSPNAVTQRAVLFSTFDLVISMLQTLQNTIAGTATALTFYGQWQQDYTNLIAKVPIYSAQSSATNTLATSIGSVNGDLWEPNSWSPASLSGTPNLANLPLVYDGLNMQDLVNSAAAQMAAAVTSGVPVSNFAISSAPFDFTFPSSNFGQGNSTDHVQIVLQLGLVPDIPPDGGGYWQLGVKIIQGGNQLGSTQISNLNVVPSSQVGLPAYVDQLGMTNALTTQFSGGTSVATIQSNMTAALNSILSNNLSTGNFAFDIVQINNGVIATGGTTQSFNYNITAGAAPQIAWQSDTTSSTDTTQTSLAAQKNAQLQQYIQNLQAYKQVVTNNAQTEQSSLDATKESITQQVDLLNVVVQTLQTILTSIF